MEHVGPVSLCHSIELQQEVEWRLVAFVYLYYKLIFALDYPSTSMGSG
jgi:hypothetical protein